MLPQLDKALECDISSSALLGELLPAEQPVVFRGLVAHWPVVQLGQTGKFEDISGYLRRFYAGATVGAWLGAPDIAGRFFYNSEMTGFNFSSDMMKLDAVLAALERYQSETQPPALYVGSTTVEQCLPGFRAENDVDIGHQQALMSIWLGNQTRIAAHFDLPDNLACVAAGHRRFILFPPSEISNLYVGPLDFTPAGQPISLVDFSHPDWDRFPKFQTALKSAKVADLGPGDALFIPSMWWHHVQAMDSFNVLINYWWRQSPADMDSPMNALMHTIMSVREMPAAQRAAWASLFNHYVFEADDHTAEHIAAHARHALSPLDARSRRAIRAQLIKNLNR